MATRGRPGPPVPAPGLRVRQLPRAWTGPAVPLPGRGTVGGEGSPGLGAASAGRGPRRPQRPGDPPRGPGPPSLWTASLGRGGEAGKGLPARSAAAGPRPTGHVREAGLGAAGRERCSAGAGGAGHRPVSAAARAPLSDVASRWEERSSERWRTPWSVNTWCARPGERGALAPRRPKGRPVDASHLPRGPRGCGRVRGLRGACGQRGCEIPRNPDFSFREGKNGHLVASGRERVG